MIRGFIFLLSVLALVSFTHASVPVPVEPARPRLLVLTDIGGDPDDQQSMIRLMTYACDFEIEGLVATSTGGIRDPEKGVVKPELIREIVEAYGRVRPNLLLHHAGYPAPDELLACVAGGNPRRGVTNIGEACDTDGSRRIIRIVDRDDPRPLNITIWGGSTELAQALWRVRHDRTPEELAKFISRIRVYAIGHQDDTGPWIVENFPTLFYILGNAPKGHDIRESTYRGMYLGGDESLTSRAWIDEHVRTNHGPLGALYPPETATAPNKHGALKEGDTPSWFYFLPNGLGDPAHPEWGSWGGRFKRADGRNLFNDAVDTVGETSDARASVWRWRPAYQADFQARMDWCVKPFAGANHPPKVILNGRDGQAAVVLAVDPNESTTLSAEDSSDPDGQALKFHWFEYREAGSGRGGIKIASPDASSTVITMPADAGGTMVHIILSVTDNGSPALTRYRRAVIRCDR